MAIPRLRSVPMAGWRVDVTPDGHLCLDRVRVKKLRLRTRSPRRRRLGTSELIIRHVLIFELALLCLGLPRTTPEA